MPSCNVLSNPTDCVCSNDKKFTEKTDCPPKSKVSKEVTLSGLANQMEAVIQRVKELKLSDLVEPITLVATKLRLLEEYSEKITADRDYADYQCSNENCCNDPSDSSERSAGADSCVCRDATGLRSCHCDSPPNPNCRAKPLLKTGTYAILDSPPPKCSPCKCAVDTQSGKRAKSSGCKLAAEARRRQRRCDSEVRDVGGGARPEPCSSDSSSESSCPTGCLKVCVSGGFPGLYGIASSQYLGSISSFDSSCYCGQGIEDEEGKTCPCGCGDMVGLPTEKNAKPQCINCGKDIIDGASSPERANVNLNFQDQRRPKNSATVKTR